MFISISNHQLKEILRMASQWKDDVEALITTIAQGNGTDPATKQAVTDLQAKLALDEGASSAVDVRVKSLEDGATEMQGVIKDIVTKLQAGDTTGALAAATAAQAPADAPAPQI